MTEDRYAVVLVDSAGIAHTHSRHRGDEGADTAHKIAESLAEHGYHVVVVGY